MQRRKETELYEPVKQFLIGLGFEVRGEVHECDLVGVRGDDLIVVELKTNFNLALVLQGIDRQRLSENVYLAVETPRQIKGVWQSQVHLCRRLGFGLLTVSFGGRSPRVQVVCDPSPASPRRDSRRRLALLKEFARRSADHNRGGSLRRPLVTAYREDALRAASLIRERGPSPVRSLRDATGILKIGTLLQQDVYGWFRRTERGVYGLTEKGEEALKRYADIIELL